MFKILKELTEIRKELQNIRVILQSATGVHAKEPYKNSRGRTSYKLANPELVKAHVEDLRKSFGIDR